VFSRVLLRTARRIIMKGVCTPATAKTVRNALFDTDGILWVSVAFGHPGHDPLDPTGPGFHRSVQGFLSDDDVVVRVTRAPSSKEPTMLIVDAQIHLWNAGNPTSPWHRQIPAYLKDMP